MESAVHGREHLARHGYLVSHQVQPTELASRSVAFDAVAANTTLQLAEGTSHAGPLQLVRTGDLEWRPHAIARSGLFLESDNTTILLGAGEYELIDPIDASVRQRFRVPAPEAIRIESRLARPRGRLP